jgi:hypothetical protein
VGRDVTVHLDLGWTPILTNWPTTPVIDSAETMGTLATVWSTNPNEVSASALDSSLEHRSQGCPCSTPGVQGERHGPSRSGRHVAGVRRTPMSDTLDVSIEAFASTSTTSDRSSPALRAWDGVATLPPNWHTVGTSRRDRQTCCHFLGICASCGQMSAS